MITARSVMMTVMAVMMSEVEVGNEDDICWDGCCAH